jgi:hypothetical protein
VTEGEKIEIEVVYALPERQKLLRLKVPAGTQAREALRLSGIVNDFPQLDVNSCPLGVFGEAVASDYELAEGDRVEIYRPLVNDPREIRRELAAHGASMGSNKQPGMEIPGGSIRRDRS